MLEPERAKDVPDCLVPEKAPSIGSTEKSAASPSLHSPHSLAPVQEDDELAISRSNSDLQSLQLTAGTTDAVSDLVGDQDSETEKSDIGEM